jgi:hypothetical protein
MLVAMERAAPNTEMGPGEDKFGHSDGMGFEIAGYSK